MRKLFVRLPESEAEVVTGGTWQVIQSSSKIKYLDMLFAIVMCSYYTWWPTGS